MPILQYRELDNDDRLQQHEAHAREPSPGGAMPVQASNTSVTARARDTRSRRAFAAAVQAKAAPARGAAISAPDASGSPLPPAVRGQMEASFGQDFSDVRVHEDSAAPSIGAVAFTRGDDIHFAPGEYRPFDRAGRELLGHELTHVVQQRAGRVAEPQGKGGIVNSDPSLEREADVLGARAARGEPVAVPESGSAGAGEVIQAKGPKTGVTSTEPTTDIGPKDEHKDKNKEEAPLVETSTEESSKIGGENEDSRREEIAKEEGIESPEQAKEILRQLITAAVTRVNGESLVSARLVRLIQRTLFLLGWIPEVNATFDYKEVLARLFDKVPETSDYHAAWNDAHAPHSTQTTVKKANATRVELDEVPADLREHESRKRDFVSEENDVPELPIFKLEPGQTIGKYFDKSLDSEGRLVHTEHRDLSDKSWHFKSGEGTYTTDKVDVHHKLRPPPSLIFTLNDLSGENGPETLAQLPPMHAPVPDKLNIGGAAYRLVKVHYWEPKSAHYMSFVRTQESWWHTDDIKTADAKGVEKVSDKKARKEIKKQKYITSVSYSRVDQPMPAKTPGMVYHEEGSNSCYVANLLYLIAGDPLLGPMFAGPDQAPKEAEIGQYLDELLQKRAEKEKSSPEDVSTSASSPENIVAPEKAETENDLPQRDGPSPLVTIADSALMDEFFEALANRSKSEASDLEDSSEISDWEDSSAYFTAREEDSSEYFTASEGSSSTYWTADEENTEPEEQKELEDQEDQEELVDQEKQEELVAQEEQKEPEEQRERVENASGPPVDEPPNRRKGPLDVTFQGTRTARRATGGPLKAAKKTKAGKAIWGNAEEREGRTLANPMPPMRTQLAKPGASTLMTLGIANLNCGWYSTKALLHHWAKRLHPEGHDQRVPMPGWYQRYAFGYDPTINGDADMKAAFTSVSIPGSPAEWAALLKQHGPIIVGGKLGLADWGKLGGVPHTLLVVGIDEVNWKIAYKDPLSPIDRVTWANYGHFVKRLEGGLSYLSEDKARELLPKLNPHIKIKPKT